MTRACLGLSLVVAWLSWNAPVRADTKDSCIAAADTGQELRDTKKLLAAREQFLACAADACPAVVRKQCAQWLRSVDEDVPTVVLGATSGGQSVADVRVSLDGVLLAERLDGQAVAVDPGPHTFRFERAGSPPLDQSVVVREWEKLQTVSVAFPAPLPAATPPEQPPAPPPPLPVSQAAESGGTQRLLGVVVGGLGVVGLGVGSYFGLHASSLYNDARTHCPTTSTCDPAGVSGGADAHGAATASTVFFVAGGALLAGAVVLYLTAPTSSPARARSLHAGPIVGANVAGMRLGGSW